MTAFWNWMFKQACEGTGLDILVIVVLVLTFIFGVSGIVWLTAAAQL